MGRAIALCFVTLVLAACSPPVPTSVANSAEPSPNVAPTKLPVETPAQESHPWTTKPFDVDLRQTPVNHWTRLRRATGTAIVDLKDAAGESLKSRFSTSLFRRLGQWWVPYPVWTQHVNGILTLGGAGEPGPWSMGLEPGEYELEIVSHLYGSLRRSFVVGRDESTRVVVRTPRFRRVLCFRFVDEQDNPVSYVGFPRVEPSDWRLPDVARPQPDVAILLRPPSEPAAEGYRHMSASSSDSFRSLWETDSGRFYVEVGAGQHSQVTFSLGKPWGQNSYQIDSDFVGPQWDDTKVTLRVATDFEQAIRRYSRTSGKAGNRALVEAPVRKDAFNPFTAPVTKGWSRVIVRVPTGWQASVESLCDGRRGYFSFSEALGVWWTELERRVPARYRVTDGCFYVSDWLPAPTDEALSVIDAPPEPPAVNIDGQGLSPTVRAFAMRVDFDLGVVGGAPFADPTPPGQQLWRDGLASHSEADSSDFDAPKDGHLVARVRMARADGLMNLVRVGGRKLQDLAGAERLATRTRAAGLPRMALWPIGDISSQHSHSGSRGTRKSDPEMQAIVADSGWVQHPIRGPLANQLLSGTIQPVAADLLCLRVVGESGEGLPWVSGTVHELDQDETALQVRRAMMERGLQPVRTDDPAAYRLKLDALTPEDSIAVADLIGPDADSTLTQPHHKHWFARNGTWYDGRNQIHSEDHGYMISQTIILKPGQVYVLYLWSQSRDDNRPDARIVFKAGQGVTDLGAIALPSYR